MMLESFLLHAFLNLDASVVGFPALINQFFWQINCLVSDKNIEEKQSTEHQDILKEFRAFLSDCKDVLDEATTLKLLGRCEQNTF